MNLKSGLALLAVSLLWISCGDSVAKVNGEAIQTDELEKIVSVRVQQYEAQGYALSDEELQDIRQELLEGLVDQTLLLQQAHDSKMKLEEGQVEEQYQTFLAQFATEEEAVSFLEEQGYSVKMLKKDIEVDLLVQKFLEAELFSKANPEDSEVQAFYDDNPSYFNVPESIHARHILIKVSDEEGQGHSREDALERIQNVETQLAEGADFAELAKVLSEGPSGVEGGDLGWFSRGQMVPPFEEAAFALEDGAISPIVETNFGFHIIKMEGRKEASVTPLEEVKESIIEFLRQDKLPALYDEYMADLKSTADIEYFSSEEENVSNG